MKRSENQRIESGGGLSLIPSLPQEVWMLVFGELFVGMDIEDFLGLSLVSAAWAKMAYESVTVMDTLNAPRLDNSALTRMVALRALQISMRRGSYISDSGLKHMTSLTRLNLCGNASASASKYIHGAIFVSDDGVKDLTNLVCLHMHKLLSDVALLRLTNLTSLFACYNVTDQPLSLLSKLTTLRISRSMSKLTQLTALEMPADCRWFSPVGMNALTNLRTLWLGESEFNFDDCLAGMTNLTSLKFENGPRFRTVSDNGLSGLLGLTELEFFYDHFISDAGIWNLTNLTRLSMADSSRITDDCLRRLVQLESLDMSFCYSITDEGLSGLHSLRELEINWDITDRGISTLTNLTALDTGDNVNLSDASLSLLTNLTALSIGTVPSRLTESGMRALTSLTNLSVLDRSNDNASRIVVKELPKLRELRLSYYSSMNPLHAFSSFPSLEFLHVLELVQGFFKRQARVYRRHRLLGCREITTF